jgi:hypothetical protein
MKLMFIIALLGLSGAAAVNAAQGAAKDWNLIRCGEKAFHVQWLEGGTFSEMLRLDYQGLQPTPLTGPKSVTVSHFLNKLHTPVKIVLSPKVILKPFIIVEQLQSLYSDYRAKGAEESAPTDEKSTLQAKIMEKLNVEKQGKQNSTLDKLSFLPYRHKVYGIHLQIQW